MTNEVAQAGYASAEESIKDLISGLKGPVVGVLIAITAIFAIIWLFRKARSMTFGR